MLSSGGDTMLMIRRPACFVRNRPPFFETATTTKNEFFVPLRFDSYCRVVRGFLPSKFLSYSFPKRFFLSYCLLSPPPFLRTPSRTKKNQNTHNTLSLDRYQNIHTHIQPYNSERTFGSACNLVFTTSMGVVMP